MQKKKNMFVANLRVGFLKAMLFKMESDFIFGDFEIVYKH